MSDDTRLPAVVERPTRSARHQRRRGRLRRVLLPALSFTVLLGVFSAGLVGWAYAKYDGQIKKVQVLQRDDKNIAEPTKQLHAQNFLIIGSDSRAGADSKFGHTAGARSDTTIVVHLSPDHRRATVISIPRDSWVDIPTCTGTDGKKVAEHHEMFNSAFSIGGPRCTIATVQKLTGIAVTHFVEIDFVGFESMVKALGTVAICSPQAVDDPNSKLKMHAGVNHLHGSQALAYVRARETLGDGSDLGRIKRQQMFMGAVLRQAMSGPLLSNPIRLTDFLDAATKAITVDQDTTFADLRNLASAMHGLDPKHVVFYTAPIANQDYSPPGTSLSGKVLLSDTAGRALYKSVIEDVKPVTVTSSGKPAPGSSTGTTGTTGPTAPGTTAPGTGKNTPKPNLNGGEKSCSL
jgi:LCP family protein required for cell wall assembly